MNKGMLKNYKGIKLVQMIVLCFITILSFVVLFCDKTIRVNVYTNRTIFFFAGLMWGLLMFSFIALFYDFSKMKYFIEEGHELNKTAYLDKMTDLPNRNSFDAIFLMKDSDRKLANLGCVLMNISNLPDINDQFGRQAGDDAIHAFSKILEKVGSSLGFVGRNGGNEYLAVLEDCDQQKMDHFAKNIYNEVTIYNNEETHSAKLKISSAYALNSEVHAKSFSDLITCTYRNSLK